MVLCAAVLQAVRTSSIRRYNTMQYCAACVCGKCEFIISAQAKIRTVCHCLACQKFTGLSFSDDCTFEYRSVDIVSLEHIEFAQPLGRFGFNRGRCSSCKMPVLSISNYGGIKYYFIPVSVLKLDKIPPVDFHVFYHRRVKDVDDGAEKISGYWRSQIKTIISLMKAAL